MMINELPRNTATIAATYFENVDDQSQFRKEMDYNMKLLSGLDPATTNQEIYEMNRQQDDKEIYGGTEQAMLDTDDPEIRGFMANRMETFGALRKSNPDLALQDFYTSVEEADRIVTDDVYRINYTNSKEDPHVYDTKYTIGMQKVVEAMDNMKPDYARLAFRYVGQPALSIGATYLGGAIGGALTKTPEGTAKGAEIGAGISDSLIAGWDSLVLGGTIYNTQEKFVNRWHELLNDKSLTEEQFAQGVDRLVEGIQMLDPAYQQEIFSAITQGPNPYADGGLTFTTFGLKTYAKPFGALARSVMKPIGFTSKSSLLKKMQMNQEIVSKIEKSMSNKVDEAVVDEAIATKVATTAPADADAKTVETVKGIEKNKLVDAKILQNSSNNKSFFNRLLEGLAGANEKTGSNQRGEIKIGKEPEQSYFIDHGKGVNNLPMTYAEAARMIKQLSGRKGFPEISTPNRDIEPDYIAISTASKTSWGPENIPAKAADVNPLGGEGGAMYGRGITYASLVDDNEASRGLYFKRFKNTIEDEYINKAKEKNIYAIDNPFFWFRNARSTLTKDEEAIIKDILNSNDKDLLEYDIFDDNYRGLKFDTQLVASEGDLESNLYVVKNDLKETAKEYHETPYTSVAQHYIQLIAERNMLENIIKHRKEYPLPEALLYTHSIKNPNKYPERYLRYEVADNNSGRLVGRVVSETDFHSDYGVNKQQQKFLSDIKNDAYSYLYNKKNRIEDSVIDIDSIDLDDQAEYYNYTRLLDSIGNSINKGSNEFSIEDWNDIMFYAAKERFGEDLTRKEFGDSIQRQMYTDAGIDGLLHSDTNVLIFNEDAIMPVNKLEKGVIRESVNDVHTQIGYDNAHMIVSAGDGVGYFVRELHGVKDAKPMIVKNGKVVDFGDYKPYNSKK